MMKKLLIAASTVSFFLLPLLVLGQPGCTASVEASVELSSGAFSLADVLAPDACPALRRAASHVPLGNAPLAGSVRVLEGDNVRSLFERISSLSVEIPERITLRRSGVRASCAEIGARIFRQLEAHLPETELESDPDVLALQVIDCGAAGRIPLNAPLEITRSFWDRARTNWLISARCVQPTDCVPFLVRVQGRALSSVRFSSSTDKKAVRDPLKQPLVHSGERVSLLWDQDGIRLTVPAVCLDRGGAGDAVRARIEHGGRVVRAVVLAAGRVRATS